MSGFNGGRRDQSDQAVPQTSTPPARKVEITGNGVFENRAPPAMPANPKPRKSPAATAGLRPLTNPVDFRRGFVLRMVGRRRATVLRPIRAWEPGRERSS